MATAEVEMSLFDINRMPATALRTVQNVVVQVIEEGETDASTYAMDVSYASIAPTGVVKLVSPVPGPSPSVQPAQLSSKGPML